MNGDLIAATLFAVMLAGAAYLIRTRYGNLAKRLRAFVDRTAGPAWVPFLLNAVYAATALGWIAVFLFAGAGERTGWDVIAQLFKPMEGR